MRFRRTALAASLTAVAVLVPTIAWYLTGSSDANRRGRAMVDETLERFGRELAADADRIGTRLEALRVRESGRPFYHYQSLFHDPRGAAQGLSVTTSPLAWGTADPLVWAHFQIDEGGQVSLPTVNERFPELSTDEGFASFCEVLGELQNAFLVAQIGSAEGLPDGLTMVSVDETVLELERGTWEQIQLAESVYAALTGRSAGEAPGAGTRTAADKVVVRVGPLRWNTLVLDSGPALAALREVTTPGGVLVQGFAVATAGVGEWLGGELGFSPAADRPPLELAEAVADTGWYLVADAAPSVRNAEKEGRQVVTEFRRTFGFSSGAAVVAGLAVVFLVAQADRLAAQRARFAAAAAHELKTPLTTLRLHSEMLADGLGDPKHRRSYAARIVTEVERLGRVVTNMLDLSRLERGAALAQPVPGDLAEITRDCVDRLRPSLEESGLEVVLEIGSELPRAMVDRDALCQIIGNLLDNADKHTRGIDGRQVTVAVDADGDRLRLRVGDNGPGVPRSVRRGLFQPFVRPKGRDEPSGLGLGLALARSLARALGGELELEDQERGATFLLSLPLA